MLVTLIGVVVAMNVKAPMKLQLGQVTGRDYIAYERMTLGNSTTGEYVEDVPVVISAGARTPGTVLPSGRQLPAEVTLDEDEGTS